MGDLPYRPGAVKPRALPSGSSDAKDGVQCLRLFTNYVRAVQFGKTASQKKVLYLDVVQLCFWYETPGYGLLHVWVSFRVRGANLKKS